MQRSIRCTIPWLVWLAVGCSSDPGVRAQLLDGGGGAAKDAAGPDGFVAPVDAAPPLDSATGYADSSSAVIGSGTPIDVEGACENLQCRQRSCTGGGTATISGKVYDPAGNNPLYNVVVYVPNTALDPLPAGVSCEKCDSLFSGTPIAATLTDAAGKFTLPNAPDGSDVPLVVQIGKWRKQYTIAKVTPCEDNPQPDHSLRLPRDRSEGDLPKIAIATGGADTLECLLQRIGVAPSEYVPGGSGDGRIQIFQGNPTANPGRGRYIAPTTSPAAPAASSALWTSVESLSAYDIVLLSCEGDETAGMNQQALHDYASAGGRVFASHFHYSWFNTGPYGSENLATWTTGANDIGNIDGTIVTTLANGQPFPKGQALAEWLGHVGALRNGSLPIEEARHNADVSAQNTPSQPWILAGPRSRAPGATQYFSFNTPTDAVRAPDAPSPYCGRVVYSDLHVGAASGDDPSKSVPQECAQRRLSPQEAALEFMLFDLSSCVTTEDLPPAPPPVFVPL